MCNSIADASEIRVCISFASRECISIALRVCIIALQNRAQQLLIKGH